ncbi:hypothetical protein ACIHCQ_31140 [Streptomyces sp. NPDC052236]|uniref:hypothetical protein n=1 Tax=Streptomyces sp. NPDC052236 TaxID=3365686 RepID=UPI0037D36262
MPNQTALLPPVGAEIPCSCYAANVPLKVRTAVINLEFKGQIKVRVELKPNEPPTRAVLLKVIGHEVKADHPQLGSVTITQEDITITPESVLELIQPFPPKLSQTMVLPFTITIERPPEGLGGEGRAAAAPLTLKTKVAPKLKAELSKFPPDGDTYKLQSEIQLVDKDSPDQTVATIASFDLQVGGL